MLRNPFKILKSRNTSGDCKVYGNNHWIELQYEIPEWNKDEKNPECEPCFRYKGELYFLSEFMNLNSMSPFYVKNKDGKLLFHGYKSDSFFSGILVKLADEGDAIKAYTYIS